jgi:hypothetical protein
MIRIGGEERSNLVEVTPDGGFSPQPDRRQLRGSDFGTDLKSTSISQG